LARQNADQARQSAFPDGRGKLICVEVRIHALSALLTRQHCKR
jgi:hypothetical protein